MIDFDRVELKKIFKEIEKITENDEFSDDIEVILERNLVKILKEGTAYCTYEPSIKDFFMKTFE